MALDVDGRSTRFAALGDPVRLALVDDLAMSDRSPLELASRHDLASNLLAHHLGVLEQAGLIERSTSSGDGRRRYVHLRREALDELAVGTAVPDGLVLFVCTHNSARSQMASVAWKAATGSAAVSAGTHPAKRVHPGAVAAAKRAGFDLSDAVPHRIGDIDVNPDLVVTVCDRAHEELEPGPDWLHWSIPDPVEHPTTKTFDATMAELQKRIDTLTGGHHGE